MKTQMLYSLKGQNMYLQGETFEDNDSNYLFYEVVNSINEIWNVSAQILPILMILPSELELHVYEQPQESHGWWVKSCGA